MFVVEKGDTLRCTVGGAGPSYAGNPTHRGDPMKKSLFHAAAAFAVVSSTSLFAMADEVATPSVTVSFEFRRQRGDTRVWSADEGRAVLSHRLRAGVNDGAGWSGIGKARLKLDGVCVAPRRFTWIPASGFTFTKISHVGDVERYTATITKVVCE
jgi:hypothetical protein